MRCNYLYPNFTIGGMDEWLYPTETAIPYSMLISVGRIVTRRLRTPTLPPPHGFARQADSVSDTSYCPIIFKSKMAEGLGECVMWKQVT